MAEVVGAVASVTQLISLSGTLLAGGYGFLSRVARAPSEIRGLLTETAAINSLLGQLQAIAESTTKPASDDALQALVSLGIFEECRTTLGLIEKALADCKQIHGKEVKSFGRRLIWPFKEKETKDAMHRLHHLRGLLANAVEANSASAIRRIEAGQDLLLEKVSLLADETKTQLSREEIRAVISWLCPSPSDGAQVSLENALRHRLPGTGLWFLDSHTFKNWISSSSESVWITGLPGSGKTLLCSSIIEKLQTLYTSPTTAVLFFFCDHRDKSKRTLENFLTSIMKQIVDSSSACFNKAKELYNYKGKNSGRSLNASEYFPLIRSMIPEFEDIYVVVDALDEASQGDKIANALSQLRIAGSEQGIPVRVLISSRYDIRIERRHPTITSVRVALTENTHQDIARFITVELLRRVSEGIIKIRDKDLVSVIEHHITHRAGTLLQARLQLDYLSSAKTDQDIKNMIQNLPNGLEYTWERLLSLIASRYPARINEMKPLFQCLIAAASPMSAYQLAEIMAMRPEQRFLDFATVTTDPYDALDIIAPFVVVDRDHKTGGTISLSHYSLAEYLSSENILAGPARVFYVHPGESHAWLASICLQYLTFSCFDTPLDDNIDIADMLDTYTLLEYAALNWFGHMSTAYNLGKPSPTYEPYISWFMAGLEGPPCYQRWQQIFTAHYPPSEVTSHSPICFAIYAGLADLTESILPLLPDVNYRFADGHTCLTAAATSDQSSIAQRLLDLGADPNLATTDRGLTPLHLAAEHSCAETFAVLLAAGANAHARSTSRTTPFYRACRGGDLAILAALRDAGSDVDARTYDGWTPLHEAVANEHADVVRALLEWGADAEIENAKGRTAVMFAERISRPIFEMMREVGAAGGGQDGGGAKMVVRGRRDDGKDDEEDDEEDDDDDDDDEGGESM
ncbi:hypothetical protein BDV95DRAFT_498197 [Massariosphaeria phaeospora]|uniref:Nephrocystin 3-like N-terminal domain-containing protein n=1 Tax=Massariosphaeria phaeospora TaxID=100035 RepID=A0A7C8M5V6_9PLEO|nr:hypothetical protein BDV95DRAFT_498197 [Massariosphaeria phaeospora]